MERYHIYKLGLAILFYAIYCPRPLLVNCTEVDDAIGNTNSSHKISAREYFVYYQGVQGRPGVDFPVFARIPRTSFSCKQVESGYYADLETDCQVFHICNDGTKVSFLCPNGTIFQQSDLICDWWFKVNCTNSPNLYEESAEQLRESYIRRKASRRVYTNTASSSSSEQSSHNPQRAASSRSNHNNHLQQNNQYSNVNRQPINRKPDAVHSSDTRQGRNRHVFAVRDSGSSEEMQITQESGSFVRNYNNNNNNHNNNYNNNNNYNTNNNKASGASSKSVTKNPYPNHRATYSDIQDPKTYYTNRPSYEPNTLNNGRPFVVSTPKVGTYTTEKPKTTTTHTYTTQTPVYTTEKAFKYSPTVPSVTKINYITPLPSITTTKKYMSNYGERIRLVNSFAKNTAKSQPKTYSNIETFTSPPSVTNGKSTTPRKPKTKNSFTIGLNSAQGPVAIKTENNHNPPLLHQTIEAPLKDPKPKGKGIIKLNLSSHGPAKTIPSNQLSQQNNKPKIRLDLGDLEVPKLRLNLDNEIPSQTNRPSPSGFYITKSTFRPGAYATSDFNAGSITGSKNTYIPTTTTTSRPETTTFTYVSNTLGFVKPTGVPKPKPFELPSTTTPRTRTTTEDYYDSTSIPNYQISSASPFTNVPPTLPSIYQGRSYVGSTPNALSSRIKQPLSENVGNMLQTLQEIANVRFAKNEQKDENETTKDATDSDKRPGLIVPPSVGPQTLHTLAVYFANALDSLVEDSNNTESQTQSPEDESTQPITNEEDNTLHNSHLSQDTINKYKDLFMIMAQQEMMKQETTTEAEDDQEDLLREHSNNAVQSPRIRQLTKVFTQALSSYLDDPESFKKALHQVRPTEPPPLNNLASDNLNNEEDELLNFSDADIKPENPRLPTLAPPNPTWGYILAYNTTTSDYKSNHIDQNEENLQGADSQSFIPGFNDLNSNRVDKSLKQGLPNNHWTSSPDVTKLWRSTLYVNPYQINQNFDATEALIPTSTEETEEFDDDSTQGSLVTQDDSINQPIDVTEYNTERYIDYELRSLPKFNLNSTSVHGLLIDFMNSSKYDESGKLQRILRKLNTTEGEFLTKMKEIEQNPLTKRLILLLVSECGNSSDAKTHAVRDIINLANQNQGNLNLGGAVVDPDQRHLRSNSQELSKPANAQYTNTRQSKTLPNSALTKLIDPSLKDDDQDSRAIQLLNSLYSIASRYGK